ncbi:MAG: class I SAM-dependent methyltransferase [Solirubrobacteraceae bacterium]
MGRPAAFVAGILAVMEADFYPRYYELEGKHWWFVGRREIFLALLRPRLRALGSSPRILDFGCGTGAFLEYLDELGEVTAVDAEADAVAFCHLRGRSEVTYVAPDAPLPFADGSFDVVTALDVVEHIDDDVAALAELRRVLRPGGVLLVAVPAFMILWGDQDEISHHHRRYRGPQLVTALESAGFAVERTSYFNALFFPLVAAVRIARRAVRSTRSDRTDLSIGPSWMNETLGRIFGAEAGVVRRSRLPFGVSLLAIARA